MMQRILAARFAIVSREQFDPCRTVSIDMLAVSAIGLRMVAAANLVEVAALVGDTARATMLNALMGGQSLTATELAYGQLPWASLGLRLRRTYDLEKIGLDIG
jgi:hypothetical protein